MVCVLMVCVYCSVVVVCIDGLCVLWCDGGVY